MTQPTPTLTFLSWVRPQISTLATTQDGGRVRAATSITLTESDVNGTPGRTTTQPVSFLLAGPADVVGLQPGAIARRYPAPGTSDHESNSCPYIELADTTLPWRYTPAPTPADAALHPWLVLIVGTEGSELTIDGGEVTIAVSAQQDTQSLGDPASPYRFAHVQDGGGHRTTRILSGRPLQPGSDYLAVVVPAYDGFGAQSWTGAAPVSIPVYDYWRFHTAVPAGSFENLAAQLHPGDADTTTSHATGRATVHYPRLPAAPALTALGALAPRPPDGNVVDDPLPTTVADDMAALQLPARDPQGRPIVTMPRYGDAWNTTAPDHSTWGKTLNLDPRHRGAAGLGLSVAISTQEDLVADVMANLGALHEARQRVRHLTLGLAVSRSLWQRRVPANPTERLWLLGPSMNRLLTPDGAVADLATADDRTMARGTFSAAARRVLRAGPARTALAAAVPTPTALLTSANRLPPPLPAEIDGIPLTDAALSTFDKARAATVQSGKVNTTTLLAVATQLASATTPAIHATATQLVAAMKEASQTGKPVPWASALAMLASADATTVMTQGHNPAKAIQVLNKGLSGLQQTIAASADDADLSEMLAAMNPLQSGDPSLHPVTIDTLAAGVAAAIDPTPDTAPAAMRVIATITGAVDPDQPLAPPEPCVGLSRPAWADLAAAFSEWLLPGVGQLPENSVIALESNATFIDSYLTGLNTQLLSELRWRNIPVATGCTPIRRFWDRADTSTGNPAEDIIGLASWTSTSSLGDSTHRAPGASGRELVIAVRGDLLLRYPTTLIYLQSAVHPGGTTADFDQDPDDAAAKVLPGFRGKIADDVLFFGFPTLDVTAMSQNWFVLEEPPAGYQFHNDLATSASTGHDWAVATLAKQVRVLIRGDSLDIGGGS